jgi:hypothetical protein
VSAKPGAWRGAPAGSYSATTGETLTKRISPSLDAVGTEPRRIFAVVLASCIATLLQACADDSAKADQAESYAAVQQLFAAANCGNFGCHGSGVIALDSRAWVETRADEPPLDRLAEWSVARDALPCISGAQNPMKRVEPGSPETSYLMHALRGTNACGGVRMPPGGPYLDERQLQLVERWIRGLEK